MYVLSDNSSVSNHSMSTSTAFGDCSNSTTIWPSLSIWIDLLRHLNPEITTKRTRVSTQFIFMNFLAFLEKFLTIILLENVKGSSSSLISLRSIHPVELLSSFELCLLDPSSKLGSSGTSLYKCFKMNRAVSQSLQ